MISLSAMDLDKGPQPKRVSFRDMLTPLQLQADDIKPPHVRTSRTPSPVHTEDRLNSPDIPNVPTHVNVEEQKPIASRDRSPSFASEQAKEVDAQQPEAESTHQKGMAIEKFKQVVNRVCLQQRVVRAWTSKAPAESAEINADQPVPGAGVEPTGTTPDNSVSDKEPEVKANEPSTAPVVTKALDTEVPVPAIDNVPKTPTLGGKKTGMSFAAKVVVASTALVVWYNWQQLKAWWNKKPEQKEEDKKAAAPATVA